MQELRRCNTLLEKARSDSYDIIYGVPEKQRQSLIRRLGSGITKRFFASIEGIDIGSSFRWMSRALIDRIEHPDTQHSFINQAI